MSTGPSTAEGVVLRRFAQASVVAHVGRARVARFRAYGTVSDHALVDWPLDVQGGATRRTKLGLSPHNVRRIKRGSDAAHERRPHTNAPRAL